MVGEISTATRIEVLGAIRSRYREAAKRDKSRMLDEFVAIVGCHRKHAVRLLAHCEEGADRALPRGRRIYDEAVRQALIVVWEASDRICGKRLKAALPSMVRSLERHGHLDIDPHVRERLLRPVRDKAGSRRRQKRKRKVGSQIPVRTFTDWNEPRPGYLEIDLVAHGGGVVSGSLHPQPGGGGTQGHLACLPGADLRDRLRQRQRVHQRNPGEVLCGHGHRVHPLSSVP